MILGFDIGNTNTRMGIFSAGSPVPIRIYSYATGKKSSPEKLRARIQGLVKRFSRETKTNEAVTGFVFSSVAPEVNRFYHRVARSCFKISALEINSASRLGITICYKDPRQLGVDRIVNAQAAFTEYGGGVIIIDIGTAATFCVLLKDGTFDGGLIAPGIGTTIRALARYASNLPEVPFEKPDRLAARDTINALKSGFYYGWVSLVEGIIERMEREYAMEFRVILTGGAAATIAGEIRHASIHDPLLTMKGIKYIYDLNR